MEKKAFFEKIAEKKIEVDKALLEKAIDFAKLAYGEEKRLSGETEVGHSISVAAILIDFEVYDPMALSAAILHGVLEDTAATQADLGKEFGCPLAELVTNVSQLSTIKLYDASQEQYVENLRRMFLAAARDVRVVLVRLADRLDNLKTLNVLPKEKQDRIAKETLEIFAPLAYRLGIGELKGQLEDLAFPYAYPQEFAKVKKISASAYRALDKFILKSKVALLIELQKAGICAEIDGRAKHLYSLWRKLERPEIGGDLAKIYDLMALRVIVDSVGDCYHVLGIVHKLWRPLPDRFYDFIATPKPNGYRSLHTIVFGPGGRRFEVQIRTVKMHEEAEFGIAAHWHYAEKKTTETDEKVNRGFATDEKLNWVRQLAAWQQEIAGSQEFLEALKIDVFSNRIFVFTPKGDVINLPAASTPVDFAYAVHSDIGNRCTGAKVDGRMRPLDYQLKNGEIVEIILAKNPAKKPSRDWLEFIVTSQAKTQIRRSLKKE